MASNMQKKGLTAKKEKTEGNQTKSKTKRA